MVVNSTLRCYFSGYFYFDIHMPVAMSELDDVVERLAATHVEPSGVSFQGKGLKLDSEDDGRLYSVWPLFCFQIRYCHQSLLILNKTIVLHSDVNFEV